MLFYSAEFKKQLKKLHKKLRNKVKERLAIFLANEFSEILDNHKLHGEYNNCRSISISGDIRVIYYKLNEKDYKMVAVGTHSQLY